MKTSAPRVRTSDQLSLKDRLSRLTFTEACKLLGPTGKTLIQRNANAWDFKLADDVYLGADLFRLRFPSTTADGKPLTVSITLMAEARGRLHWHCTGCPGACEHVGAAFSLILEEKSALGLAAPPAPPREPVESLAEDDLVARALADRAERAKTEKMTLRSADATRPWTDYTVTSALSGKTYRVALRGAEPGSSYCSCPDFRTNTLGTCKHVMHVLNKVRRRFPAQALRRRYVPTRLALHLRYVGGVSLWLQLPQKLDEAARAVFAPLADRPITDVQDLCKRMAQAQQFDCDVLVYPDAEEFIQQRLTQDRMRAATAAIRRDPHNHPLRKTLLNIPLLPYQLDGVAFAAGAGRAILADEMGLGKTIQGIGTAELLAREAGIRRVLVVCPASLKSQWRAEIERTCGRQVQLVGGAVAERPAQYDNDCFFTICNYEQVLRDVLAIERVSWDLIILDEAQRIKNWEAKTARTIKSLRSRFALALSGTPLENRLDDLYSIVQFIDDRRLGPGFRFFNRHRVVDEKGKVLGYKNLGQLRQTIQPILLRRTRDSVRLELPPRTIEFVRIAPARQQQDLHDANMQVVATIVRKKFISEMDLLRLQKALLMCRMAADSTFLVDKQAPGHSTKLARLNELLEELFEEDQRKVIVFSEWTTMLDLIEPLLKRRKLDFVRLDGSVPQKRRAELVHRFQNSPDCRLFLTTNAGSTGLNLQAADTVINVDLPWNPAVLEQRIARAHRMGQKQAVQAFVLVTEHTIEENLLATIAAKKDLALAALDAESETDEVELASGMQELKGRLEVLLGARPEAAADQSTRQESEQLAGEFAHEHRERVAAASGELLGAAFKLLGELVSPQPAAEPPQALVADVRAGLGSFVSDDSGGKPRLTIILPNAAVLDTLAQTLARLLVAGSDSVGAASGAAP
jgi:superfamily II DNA or RNA helicase